MSLQDQITADDQRQDEDKTKYIEDQQSKLFSLKGQRDLFDDPKFIRWYKKYILEPYQKAKTSHEATFETNKSFSYKGEVRAYSSAMLSKAELNREIEAIEDEVRKHNIAQHEQDTDHKPHN